jgi:hypothetical protein
MGFPRASFGENVLRFHSENLCRAGTTFCKQLGRRGKRRLDSTLLINRIDLKGIVDSGI